MTLPHPTIYNLNYYILYYTLIGKGELNCLGKVAKIINLYYRKYLFGIVSKSTIVEIVTNYKNKGIVSKYEIKGIVSKCKIY